MRSDPNFIVSAAPNTPILIGGVLEIIVALAGIGTAVALYPMVKRQNEGVAPAWSARGFWKPPPSSRAS